jgi:SAM-dependent methyltransferase
VAERTTGVRSILSMASVYRLTQNAIGAERARRRLAAGHIKAEPGQRVFDIGSGTSDILDHLPSVEYFGLEPSGAYVDAARKRFGSRATILHGGVDDFDPEPWAGTCDLVLSVGVLHHLTDDQAAGLLSAAARLLKPGGRFVAMDPCLETGQNPIARALIVRDRGQHVRTRDQAEALLGDTFRTAAVRVRTDLLHVPYTHSIIEAAA